jgi:hypothetical protein
MFVDEIPATVVVTSRKRRVSHNSLTPSSYFMYLSWRFAIGMLHPPLMERYLTYLADFQDLDFADQTKWPHGWPDGLHISKSLPRVLCYINISNPKIYAMFHCTQNVHTSPRGLHVISGPTKSERACYSSRLHLALHGVKRTLTAEWAVANRSRCCETSGLFL